MLTAAHRPAPSAHCALRSMRRGDRVLVGQMYARHDAIAATDAIDEAANPRDQN